MDLRKIRKLIEIFNASKLSEIEIKEGDESIRLTRTAAVTTSPAQAGTVVPEFLDLPSGEIADVEIDEEDADDTFVISSPMVGTFYTKPTVDDPPFVKVGDQVEVGQPLCLIEAMKIFNQIDADRSGTIVKVLKTNGDPVEYGEPLFLLQE